MPVKTIKDEQGRVTARYFINDKGQKDGPYETYDTDGNIVLSGEYKKDEPYSGEFVGTMKWNGEEIKWRSSYKDGKPEGGFYAWTSRGETILSGSYQNGKKIGSWTEAIDEEEDRWYGEYVDGQRDGTWFDMSRTYHRRYKQGLEEGDYDMPVPERPELLLGSGWEEGICYNGKREGNFKFIERETLRRNIEGVYKNGRVVRYSFDIKNKGTKGKFEIAYRKGNVIATYSDNEGNSGTYVNGVKAGQWQEREFYRFNLLPSGDVPDRSAYVDRLVGNYHDGVKEGKWKCNGGFLTFHKGKLNGPFKLNGEFGQYKDGELDGECVQLYSGHGDELLKKVGHYVPYDGFYHSYPREEEIYILHRLKEHLYAGDGRLVEKRKCQFNQNKDLYFDYERFDENGCLSEKGTRFYNYRGNDSYYPGSERILYNPDGSVKERILIDSRGKELSKEQKYKIDLAEIRFEKRVAKKERDETAERIQSLRRHNKEKEAGLGLTARLARQQALEIAEKFHSDKSDFNRRTALKFKKDKQAEK